MGELEQAAVNAHARGDTWEHFWTQYGRAVLKAERRSGRRLVRLIRRLRLIVADGEPAAGRTENER